MKQKYQKYLQQYIAHSQVLNMEFSEFLSVKLNISEIDARKLITKQKRKLYETTDR